MITKTKMITEMALMTFFIVFGSANMNKVNVQND